MFVHVLITKLMTLLLNASLALMDSIGIKLQRNAQAACRPAANVPWVHSAPFVSPAIQETVRQANAFVHQATSTVLLETA